MKWQKFIYKKKAQIAPFMILVIGVLLLAVAATMLIGEIGFSRIRLVNVADGALISSASSFCREINQIRVIKNQMRLNYISLVARSLKTIYKPYTNFWQGVKEIYGDASNLMGILGNYQLFENAKDLADDAVKNLRKSLYDSCLGAGLIDEPKPFLSSEIKWEDNQPGGRIIGLDLEAYSKRDSHFESLYRSLRKTDGWEGNALISYSFNKKKDEFLAPDGKGKFNFGEPDHRYQSYLKVKLDVPLKVKVRAKVRPILFFWEWKKGKTRYIFPGSVLHPWAEMDLKVINESVGLTVEKKYFFKNLPFFGRDVVLKHTNRARITGGGTRVFDFTVEK